MPIDVLVIRAKDKFSSILIERGFTVINLPLIKSEPLEDLSKLEDCLEDIESFDGIFVTSANAARIVSRKILELQIDFKGKFYVLGGRSNKIITGSGFKTFFRERAATAEEMLKLIPDIETGGKKFLFPCGNKSLRIIPETLRDKATVQEVVVYKTSATEINEKFSENIKIKFKKGKIAATCFFSPSAAESFIAQFGAEVLHQTIIAVIGKTTAEYFERRNLNVDFVSSKSNAENFAIELIEYLRKES